MRISASSRYCPAAHFWRLAIVTPSREPKSPAGTVVHCVLSQWTLSQPANGDPHGPHLLCLRALRKGQDSGTGMPFRTLGARSVPPPDDQRVVAVLADSPCLVADDAHPIERSKIASGNADPLGAIP